MAQTDINNSSRVGAQGALGAGQAESLDLHASLEKEGRYSILQLRKSNSEFAVVIRRGAKLGVSN